MGDRAESGKKGENLQPGKEEEEKWSESKKRNRHTHTHTHTHTHRNPSGISTFPSDMYK
jgi:hypothetical protein